jgi:hypothetical protein
MDSSRNRLMCADSTRCRRRIGFHRDNLQIDFPVGFDIACKSSIEKDTKQNVCQSTKYRPKLQINNYGQHRSSIRFPKTTGCYARAFKCIEFMPVLKLIYHIVKR